MNKTVPELAEILNINKLRIYRYINKEKIKPSDTIKGVQYFSDTQQKAIIEHFKSIDDAANVSSNISRDTSDTASDTLKHKDDIIRRQDNEIKRLYKQLDSMQRTIEQQNKQFDQQQQLELESIRTIKATGLIPNKEYRPDTASDTADTKSDTRGDDKKGGLFAWLKHSKH